MYSQVVSTHSIPIYKLHLSILYFFKKIVSAINVSILYINITKLCMCNKFDILYFKIS